MGYFILGYMMVLLPMYIVLKKYKKKLEKHDE